MSEKLSRKELLSLLNQSRPDRLSKIEDLDELDKKALLGYEYLENADAGKAIENLEKRFDKWLPSQQISRSTQTIKLGQARLWRRVAAAALVLLIPAFFLLRAPSPDKLVEQYFEAPRSTYLNVSRGQQGDALADITDAFTLYERKQYLEAAEAISVLTTKYPDKRDLNYYWGISLLAAGQVDQAIAVLQNSVIENYQNTDKKNPWYLGLAYLKKGNTAEASKWFEETIKVDDFHREQAIKLLQKIN